MIRSLGVNFLPLRSREDVYIFPDNEIETAPKRYSTTNAPMDCQNETAPETALTAAMVGLVKGKKEQNIMNGLSG